MVPHSLLSEHLSVLSSALARVCLLDYAVIVTVLREETNKFPNNKHSSKTLLKTVPKILIQTTEV